MSGTRDRRRRPNAEGPNVSRSGGHDVQRRASTAPRRYVFVAVSVVALLAVAYAWHFNRDGGSTPRDAAAGEPTLYIGARDAGYLPGDACKACHADIYETYEHTGMGRSFYRLRPENMVEDFRENNEFYHEASDRHYQMIERDGRYYQRRYQIGFDGSETNVVEKPVDFVVGSGNHSRTYLHQTASGGLIELPLAWYSANGGYWAMNPGYDRPNHEGFRRRLTYECVFCHNGYPELREDSDMSGSDPLFSGSIPSGIDCQRCHGPGREHVESVNAGRNPDEIRAAIVNPGKLDADRQMDVCLQCHLETTSLQLPNALHRVGRGVFSYQPGERLSDYVLHFDHEPGAGYDDKFEIAHQGYRLNQSACFRESGGRMTCITCHNPHEVLRGEAAAQQYVAVCQSCHQERVESLVEAGSHTASTDCLTCHMPKRRTQDAVHVVMTDHYIQRHKPGGNLLAPLKERPGTPYSGEVHPYNSPESAPNGEDELYLATAQVKHNSNVDKGIPRLLQAIEKFKPAEPEFYFELASAYSEDGRPEESLAFYKLALERDADYWPALHGLGLSLARAGRLEQSASELEKAHQLAPAVAVISNDLGLTYLRQNRLGDAIGAFRQAIAADPDSPDAYNNLGGVLRERSDIDGAEQAFRTAIRNQPDSAPAHDNLATLLVLKQDLAQAEYHFRKSIAADNRFAPARLDFGLALYQQDRYSEALEQLNAAAELDPESPQTQTALGDLFMAQGDLTRAVSRYRQAVILRPDNIEAMVGLGIALIEQQRFGDAQRVLEAALEVKPNEMEVHFHLGRTSTLLGRREEARAHLQQATTSSTPAIRQAALEMIDAMNRVQPSQ